MQDSEFFKLEIVSISGDAAKQKPIVLTADEYAEIAGALQWPEDKAAWNRTHTPTKVQLNMEQ